MCRADCAAVDHTARSDLSHATLMLSQNKNLGNKMTGEIQNCVFAEKFIMELRKDKDIKKKIDLFSAAEENMFLKQSDD